ncbi:glycosylhydrolase [Haloferula helveola]|uniref:Glycosylhydrolase n=1 Tax=Haloferula helveola TaxID=490095 RepID=A0ABN6H3C3_9BACT|nr:glycosylhydrolase [Haloferula helveola]
MKFLIPIIALTAAALAEEAPMKFVPIFDGKTLDGWKGDGYVVEDGAIVCTPKGRNLVSDKIYANYVLDFQFKLPPGGNNGIGIHYPGQGDAAYTGMELQVLDNTAEKYKGKLKPYQFHGSIYTMVPAKQGFLKPVGEWNQQRITVHGPHVRVELNGTVITEANLDELNKKFPKHEGAKRRAGHIAMCGHGDKVAFRGFKICELPPAANIDGVKSAGFTQIFDGKTLKGWKAPAGAEGHWNPVNGILKYDGRSKDLWSEKSYKDFTVVFDWRWGAPGKMMDRPIIGPDGKETGEKVKVQELDSGVYLRGSSKSQVNLWNWPVGSGEVYGYRTDGKQPAEVRAGVTPTAKADKPVGEWNRMMITVKGEKLTVVLNGQTVIEDALLPGMKPEGPIALQHHGSQIDFANIWIKEL